MDNLVIFYFINKTIWKIKAKNPLLNMLTTGIQCHDVYIKSKCLRKENSEQK